MTDKAMTHDQIRELLAATTQGEIDVHRIDEPGGEICYQLQKRADGTAPMESREFATVLGYTEGDIESRYAKGDAALWAASKRVCEQLLGEVRELNLREEQTQEAIRFDLPRMDALRARAEKAEATLAGLQWSVRASWSEDGSNACPSCWRLEKAGHKEDCEIGTALGGGE